ncbi:class A beta-lactamase [Novosphingobium sp. PASSN1]|uniref:class A beta-lactamase n=1 Tax=Novosphingobium sp. PASSN1 TaxID=2015561 RepID=UPI000BDD30DA|nr:class A beta-lactamase [Novosphingobium sp. PASSN1]OYU36498.1 MAG: serine hydrolase [Novosphingobium sp. PASSN1]
MASGGNRIGKWIAAALWCAAPLLLVATPAQARPGTSLQNARDAAIEQQVAAIVAQGRGRIGVAAVDLDGGGQIMINGDMPFPMASTAKVAIAATYLAGVEQGRLRLDQQFPMMVPVAESPQSRGAVAAVRPGEVMTAQSLMELSITRSDNHATDGLIAAVGGINAVNTWLSRIGVSGQRLDHTMATLVRDDGRVNPVTTIDTRTSSTPRAMAQLLAAIDRGGALSPESRAVLLDTMTRTSTGRNRIRSGLPEGVVFAHKTGTLSGVTDDVGIVRLPDGRHLAIAIFVTGPEGHTAHAGLIAQIARVLYDGYSQPPLPSSFETARR